jgi:hypothetical protein
LPTLPSALPSTLASSVGPVGPASVPGALIETQRPPVHTCPVGHFAPSQSSTHAPESFVAGSHLVPVPHATPEHDVQPGKHSPLRHTWPIGHVTPSHWATHLSPMQS